MNGKATEQLASLSPQEQRVLLARMLKDRIQKPKFAPLSFAQERLWFLNQLYPDSVAYNISAAIRFTGQLDVPILGQCLKAIVRRHETLRTTFISKDGTPMQVIAPSLDLAFPLVDLEHLPAAKREVEARKLAADEMLFPMDLTRGPLIRTTLLRLSDQEHVLLLTVNHIVSDGWSADVFVKELAALYEAFSSGAPSPLPDLPLQYADFAVWQRQWLQGETLDKLLSYWKQKLSGSLSVLDLPSDRPRPPVQTTRGKTYWFVLPHDLCETLKAFSYQEGVTLFSVLLAAFKVLLFRYTGQTDILLGSPMASRNQGDLEKLIGFFANTIVLRTDLSGNPSFRQLLKQMHETSLEALEHQALPFKKLVEELQPERNRSQSPLFQVLFALQTPPQLPQLPSLSLSVLEPEVKTAKFDLSLAMMEKEQQLKGVIEYNTDLFDTSRIIRMAGHFQTLLESIVADPEQPISEVAILSKDERQQVLVAWNNIQMDYPQDCCIHELFEAQVAQTPDAIAVVFGEKCLTCGELNRRANQLAHYLLASGLRSEELVGICMERSMEMITGVLGILKAGGAYVPLDPTYPKERLSFMLADSHISVLLTTEAQLMNLPPHGGRAICLDTEWWDIESESGENPVDQTTAQELAYVIYTSGSTGQPKGVSIEHRSVVNMITSFTTSYTLRPSDRVLQQTSLCFDVSVGEIWPILCVGGSLVLLDRQVHQFEQVLSFLVDYQVTIIGAVPSVLSQLNERLDKLPHLRLILSGGEALSFSDIDRLISQATVTNGYGPTETTVCSSFYRLHRNDFPAKSNEEKTTVPIGRPIINTQIYLVDRHLQPVPVGVPGELCIGGAGLARGYHDRPESSAESFIPNPFTPLPSPPACGGSQRGGTRLYRTGDLARYRQDGNIEFLGRIDQQVKVRGFRIELEEIEKALVEHPAVQQAVIAAREDSPGQKRLVAYVVPSQEVPAINESLGRFLQERLPSYMVPATFMTLEALPLMPNGKVDRQALPAPDQTRPDVGQSFVAPRTPVEKVLADIWKTVLGIEEVGIHDNFFELGGHSLLATQVVSHARHNLGIELPLWTIFQAPTVSELAETMLEDPSERSKVEKTAELLIQIAQLSEEEVEAMLAGETSSE